MSEAPSSPLDEVRNVLFGAERHELDQLRVEVLELRQRIDQLHDLLAAADDRAVAVGEVLVDAVERPPRPSGVLGKALQPDIEHAVHASAREDSTVLAEALYPVMGPAMRKMIADLFTFDRAGRGDTFVVDEVLLIERTGGLLLAGSYSQDDRAEDSDIVSGMLDAIRLFVQEAFDAEDHDGLRDLRVGETSVLVEWGPKAVLASVVRGIPSEEYRHRAAETLELIHARFAHELSSFVGEVDAFDQALPALDVLRSKPRSSRAETAKRTLVPAIAVLTLVIVVILLLVWLL